jgi:Abnormal spindle-like microcephaly-assoc'd, ASPM-SPD-2-Hydin
MTCTPLRVGTGLFLNDQATAWSSAPTETSGPYSVTRTASQISFSGPNGSGVHQASGNHTIRYRFFGAGFLAILESETGAGSITHWVSLVDFTTTPPTERPLYSGLARTTDTLPHIEPSPASSGAINGIAFFTYAPDSTQVPPGSPANVTHMAIYRSDTGALLCPGPLPFTPSGQVVGQATATNLIIRYSTGASIQPPCPLPQGRLTVTPASQSFGSVAVGGCAVIAPTRTFTLNNNGNDCLTVSAIGSVAPFSLASASLPATLSPGQTLTATISFNPTAPGWVGPTNLPITRSPANGADHFTCLGMAYSATTAMAISPNAVAFGLVEVGTAATRTLTITNPGESPLNVTVAGSSGGSFAWPGWSGTLPCGGIQGIPVTFSPTAWGMASSSLSVTSNAPGSPASIALTGAGWRRGEPMAPDRRGDGSL